MLKSKTYCVIMAGGIGSRFWPLSKEETPKQFLDILGIGKTLIQQTFERFIPICPVENFLIVTSEKYFNLVKEQLPQLKDDQILLEPARRNTAPCIAYANAHIKKRNNDAIIVVTPSDHLIVNEDEYRTNIIKGLEFSQINDSLLTMGIKPHRPETGYGYIQTGKTVSNEYSNFKNVKTFTEKPNLELAKVFFESGEFFWNSGIFIWSLKSIEKAFYDHLPDVKSLFDEHESAILTPEEPVIIKNIYSICKNISIDYGVMEKANNVFVQIVNFGWSDLGTWSSLHEHSNKDNDKNAVLSGHVQLYDTNNSIIHLAKGKKAIINGLNNFIVVDTTDELLICPMKKEQKITQYLNDLKTEFGN
ncbi:MAG: mannose-1-phosphate guanylyltransferase [Marinilabiliaceae bacterium]|nr:mannose-1-phosphate guanylyltransferase [Marinilabiliaceae bacterium]